MPPFERTFSRFTRKREHAVAFKSMLRRRGIQVTSITEHAGDSPTGKLMEAIIESGDEFYSENLHFMVSEDMRLSGMMMWLSKLLAGLSILSSC
ncbi:MAG: recombinase family protein [Chloroflexi bacterium]|nr:recombinase family protein [Chloroflexota bacterium]